LSGQTQSDHTKIADSLAAIGDLENAAEEYKAAFSADETNLAALRKLADVSTKLGRFEVAQQALLLAVERNKTDSDSYLELARLAWLSGDFRVALDYIDLGEKSALSPSDKVPSYRSIVFRGQGRLAEAESVLVAARKDFPRSPMLLSNLGLVAALSRGPDEGFEHVRLAYSIDSTDVYVLSSFASLYLALGEVDSARTYYEKALAVDPQNFLVRTSLENIDKTAQEMRIPRLMQQGVDYFERSLYLKAKRAFQEVISLDSTYFDAYLNLGFTFNVLGEPRNAASAFEKARSLDSMSAPLYIGWGNALAGLGDYDTAISLYETALALDSTVVEAKQALQAVQQLKERLQQEGAGQ
jgi:tetratricopeptide (TPR) repeat protein